MKFLLLPAEYAGLRRLHYGGLLVVALLAVLAASAAMQWLHISRLQSMVNVILALLLVLALKRLQQRNAGLWAYVPLLVVPLLPQLLPTWASWWHGFMHSSIVYDIYQGHMPPFNPLLATEPLLYPWVHHALIARLMQAVPLSPVHAFIATDVVALLLFALFMERAARQLTANRTVRAYSVLLALLTPNLLVQAPLLDVVGVGGLGFPVETRMVPLGKFIGINNNQLGLVCCALALYGLMRLSRPECHRAVSYLCLASALIAAAFLYPTAWLNIALCLAVVAVCWCVARLSFRTSIDLLLLVIGCSMVALPYLLSIVHGKAPEAGMYLSLAPEALARKALNLAGLLLVAIPLLTYARRRNMVLLPQGHAGTALFACVGVSCLMFLGLSMPEASEYKYLQLGILALALPCAIALEDLERRHRWAGLAVLGVVAMNYAVPFNVELLRQPVADAVYSDGRWLRHQDPAQDALYQWLATRTPDDALLVDSHLAAPALARRGLLIGVDLRLQRGGLRGESGTLQDGWMMNADEFLHTVAGSNGAKVERLQAAATQLLTPAHADSDKVALQLLLAASNGRPLLLVIRDATVVERLSRQALLQRAWSAPTATVFRVAPSRWADITRENSPARR